MNTCCANKLKEEREGGRAIPEERFSDSLLENRFYNIHSAPGPTESSQIYSPSLC